MMYKNCLIAIFFSLLSVACDSYSAEISKMKEENKKLNSKLSDLEAEDKIMKGEYSEAMSALNSIDDTLKNITEREKKIKSIKQKMESVKSSSQREKMTENLELLLKANQNARNQVQQLQNSLQKYKGENESLRRMIDQAESRVKTIDEDLKSKRNSIGNMKATLQKTEKELANSQSDLGKAYEELKEKNEKLQIANEKLEKSIADLKVKEDFIGKEAMAYVCCGTKKYLRQKEILNNTTLKLTKNFQSSAQAVGSKINYYDSNIIDCSSGNITNILPERAPESYKIEGSKLIVRNTELFWKTDKVVVLVKDK